MTPDIALDVVSPVSLPGFDIKTMEFTPAISDEEEVAANGRRRENVLVQGVGPDFRGLGNVTSPRGVDTFDPRFVLTPKDVTAACHDNAVLMEDGHSINVARAFTTIGVVAMDQFLRRGRVGVELPGRLQQDGRVC